MALENKKILNENVQTWDDARKLIFDHIFEVLQNDKHRISTYEIMGYMYLSTRLILRYHDCFQIFEFDYWQNDKQVVMEKFFTEDFTSDQQMFNTKDFSDRYNRDQPEIK